MTLVEEILLIELPPVEVPDFKCAPTKETADKNKRIIQQEVRVKQAFALKQKSPIGYGSEFHPVYLIHTLMQHHSMWRQTATRIANESSFPLEPI